MKKSLIFIAAALSTVTLLSEASPSTEAKVYSRDNCVRLRESTNIWPEEASTYHAFPEEFDGYRITLLERNSTQPLVFSVKKAGLVRITALDGFVPGLKREGWVEIGRMSILTENGEIFKNAISILEKKLNVGEYSIPSHGNYGVRLLRR